MCRLIVLLYIKIVILLYIKCRNGIIIVRPCALACCNCWYTYRYYRNQRKIITITKFKLLTFVMCNWRTMYLNFLFDPLTFDIKDKTFIRDLTSEEPQPSRSFNKWSIKIAACGECWKCVFDLPHLTDKDETYAFTSIVHSKWANVIM